MSTGRLRQSLAWCVHAYTALGLVAAAGMACLVVEGTEAAFGWCFALMLVASLIDATDGFWARALDVKKVLPGFDGRRLDDIIDFLTYTALPLLLVWRAEILPRGQEAWLLVPLVASAYGFCQVNAKTDDGYFLGFPSLWNLVAFYLYALDRYVMTLPAWLSIGILVGFALLTFVPTRYLYPSLGGRFVRSTYLLGIIWLVLVIGIILCLIVTPAGSQHGAYDLLPWLIVLSLYFPAYYLLASWTVTWQLWHAHRRRAPVAVAASPDKD